MDTKNINRNINERIIKMSGGIIGVLLQPPTETAQYFKRALFDYSIEKLLDTDENKVIVEDIGVIFSRLDKQFTSRLEQEKFYHNYVLCILDKYSELIGTEISWELVSEESPKTFPRIEECCFLTKRTTTSEEAAIWLFRQYDQKLKEKIQASNSKERKKHPKCKVEYEYIIKHNRQ